MFILTALGWISIAAGALAAWAGISEGNMFWVAIGIANAISEILFLALALDRGLVLLTQIRDALVETPLDKPIKPPSTGDGYLDGE